MIKLNLGCGIRQIPHYINIDADSRCNPDKTEDVCLLPSFEVNTVDVIYCSHVLEHFPKKEISNILQRWYNLLKKGGILRVAVPDLDKVFRHYIYYNDLSKLMAFLYGSQEDDYQFHKMGWNFETLKAALSEVGFSSIKLFDWRNLEHYYIDDHSQGYLPHMDKENGVLMSLNVEAIK
jgi:predicted SAM-dependent methyltransferase